MALLSFSYLFFVALAAFFYALTSALQFRFGWIRFKFITKNPNFWNPKISYAISKTIGGYKIDGFHLMQSACFAMWAFAVVFYSPIFNWWVGYLAIGIVWTVLFPLFYGWIAPKPK